MKNTLLAYFLLNIPESIGFSNYSVSGIKMLVGEKQANMMNAKEPCFFFSLLFYNDIPSEAQNKTQ